MKSNKERNNCPWLPGYYVVCKHDDMDATGLVEAYVLLALSLFCFKYIPMTFIVPWDQWAGKLNADLRTFCERFDSPYFSCHSLLESSVAVALLKKTLTSYCRVSSFSFPWTPFNHKSCETMEQTRTIWRIFSFASPAPHLCLRPSSVICESLSDIVDPIVINAIIMIIFSQIVNNVTSASEINSCLVGRLTRAGKWIAVSEPVFCLKSVYRVIQSLFLRRNWDFNH